MEIEMGKWVPGIIMYSQGTDFGFHPSRMAPILVFDFSMSPDPNAAWLSLLSLRVASGSLCCHYGQC